MILCFGRNIWWKLHKNAACYFVQTLEAALYKIAVVKPFHRLSRNDEQDMLAMAGEERINSKAMLSYGLQHMDTPVLADQQKPKFMNFLWTE